jgi:hypothetical protein
MKSPWNKILPFIPITIGMIIMVVGILSRALGDTTGSDLVVMGSLVLIIGIAAFSSQRTRSKM